MVLSRKNTYAANIIMFDVNVDRIFALDYPEVKKSILYNVSDYKVE